MSDTILSGDLTVYYLAENRQKRIVWSGSATGTQSLLDVYKALQDLFDDATQMDDGVPMSGQTPTEFTIGKIDPGDSDPWFISLETMEHITGGALKTSGWARVSTTNTGIVVVGVDNATNNIVLADVGYDITHTNLDSGVLLDVVTDSVGGTDWLFIRPDSSATANDFNDTSGTLTCNAHTATQTDAAVTGDQVWANLYSLGTIEGLTHIYVFQDGERVTSIDSTTSDWWGDGHIDACFYIKDFTTASFPTIDAGYLTVLARQYSKSYDNFEVLVSTTAGGRNPIPLATGDDLNNETGYKRVTLSGTSGSFSVGDEVSGDTSGARVILTDVDSFPTVDYYIIGEPPTDLNGSEAVTNETQTGAATGSGATSDVGPANLTTDPVITHANTTFDVDDDGTAEPYSITIDVNQNTLADLYEWTKYITRRGGTTTANTDGLQGQEYIGNDYRLRYSGSVSGGTIDEGNLVIQATTLAQGYVVSHDTTNKIITLRNSRGTFNTTNVVTDQTSSGAITPDTAATGFSPVKAAPFGTLAGGVFFGAPGVLLSDYQSSEENSFQLKDDYGTVNTRPTSVTMTVNNLVVGDFVGVFRLTGSGGTINKQEYSLTAQSAGATSVIVGTTIAVDVPGKSAGGVIKVVDYTNDPDLVEYRLRYTSWATSTFTLFNMTGLTADGSSCTSTQLTDTGANFVTNGVKVGDLIRNTTEGVVAYVTAIVGENELTTTPVTDWTSDAYEIGTLPFTTDTSDYAYIPIIDEYVASGTSVDASMVYSAQIYVRARVRNAGTILPFEADTSITTAGGSATAVRTADNVYNA